MANQAGIYQAITDVSTVQLHALGDRVTVDGNEYIYLQGVSSGAAGKWVTFDESYVTTLLAGNAVGQVAILMSTMDATTDYGWGQIFGVNTIASTDTIAADKQLYIDDTAGRADDASATGDLIVGAISRSADTSNVATVQLSYPFVTDVLG